MKSEIFAITALTIWCIISSIGWVFFPHPKEGESVNSVLVMELGDCRRQQQKGFEYCDHQYNKQKELASVASIGGHTVRCSFGGKIDIHHPENESETGRVRIGEEYVTPKQKAYNARPSPCTCADTTWCESCGKWCLETGAK